MKIQITETENQLSYKVDAEDLPANSAIREYKHPEDIDKEAWRDFLNEANGDVLAIEYIGTEAGFAKIKVQVPENSELFSLSFVNRLDRVYQEFTDRFENWLSSLKESQLYQDLEDSQRITVEFNRLKNTYQKQLLIDRLQDFGLILLKKVIPVEIDTSIAETLNDVQKQSLDLVHSLEQLDTRKKALVNTDKVPDTIGVSEKADTELEKGYVKTEKIIHYYKSRMNNSLEQNSDREDEIVQTGIENISKALGDYQRIVTSFDKNLDYDAYLTKSMNQILENVYISQAEVTEVDFGNQINEFKLAKHYESTMEDRHQLQLTDKYKSNKIVNPIIESALCQLVNISRLFELQLLDTKSRERCNVADLKKQEEIKKEQIQELNQQTETIKQQLQRKETLRKLLVSAIKLEKEMPRQGETNYVV